MKKIKVFGSLVTIVSVLLLSVAPAFALGEVDLGTTSSSPTVSTETTTPSAPTVSSSSSTTSTPITSTPTTVTSTTTPTEPTTTTTVGSTTVATDTSVSTSTPPATTVTVSDTIPPVITNVVSASLLPTEATVAWTTDELAVSHFRYGTTTAYGSTVTLGASGALIHAATMLNLTAGTTYHYCIDATDLFGNTAESCGHQFITAAQTLQADTNPPTISSVVVAPITTTSAVLTWTTDELANGHVQYGTTQDYGSTAGTDTDFTLMDSTTLSNLLPNTVYHYRIVSHDEIGNAASTPDETFTTQALAGNVQTDSGTAVTPATPIVEAPIVITLPVVPAQTAPEVSSITIAPVTETAGTITWTTDKLSTAQVHYGATSSYGSTATVGNSSLTHSTTLLNLTPSTTYHFSIVSDDGSGHQSSTPDETFTTDALAVVVSTGTVNISSVGANSIDETSAVISWTTDVPSDSRVDYGVTENLGTETSGTALVTSHSVAITNLVPGTRYHFQVVSKPLGASVSTASNLHDFSTLITPIFVTTPANVLTVSSGSILATSANVSWTTDIATTGHVEYGITTEYGQTGLSAGNQTQHTVSLSDLAPGTTYHYRVKAVNTAGDITYSDDQTFTTPIISSPSQVISIPSAIVNLSVPGYDETSAQLAWNAPSPDADAAMFTEIRFSTSPITESNFSSATSAQITPVVYPELSPNGTARGYLVAGLVPNTTYYFAIKQKYQTSDWSGVSNVATVTTLASLPTGDSNSANVEVSNTDSNNLLVSPEITTTANIGNSSDTSNMSPIQPFMPETTTSLPIEHPTFLNGSAEDRQIVFTWDNPSEADFVRTIIMRKVGSYPTSPTDGTTVYESDGETFTDTNLTNGTTYYYAFYSYDHARAYSEAVRASLAPVATVQAIASSGGASGGSIGQVVFHETPVIVPADVTEHFATVWKKGDSHIEIEHIQHLLATDGEFYPNEKIDGKFGVITEKGLKQFQAKYKLPITGVTDQSTQKQLGIASQSLVRLAIPDDVGALETDLKLGDKNAAVEDLQEMLAQEGVHNAVIDGNFGSATQASVKAFQKKYFIKPVTGAVGPKTRHMLKILSGL